MAVYQVSDELVQALAREFIKRSGDNYTSGSIKPTTGAAVNLGDASHVFSELYVGTVHAANIQVTGTPTSDSVDGFHASATPKPNTLLPLNSSGVFPTSVYNQALLKTGGTLEGNLAVAGGVTIDGVDLNVLSADFSNHKAMSVMDAHSGGIGPHDHRFPSSGGDLVQYAQTEGYGTRPAYAANRVNRKVQAGSGLLGGGTLDQDITLSVKTGNGLRIDPTTASVALDTPGTLSAASGNTASIGHTHYVDASFNPTGSSLLKSDQNGVLVLQKLALGTTYPAEKGDLAATGTVSAKQIVSALNTFVGNDLSVGTDILVTAKERKEVYVNGAGPYGVSGSLTVSPGSAAQRGLVVRGKPYQEASAPLFSVENFQGQDLLLVQADGSLESGDPGFVSGVSGWKITHDGDAEFRNVTARGELHTSIFSANEIHATGGSLAVMPTGVVGGGGVGYNVINDVDGGTAGTQFYMVISGVSGQGLAGLPVNGSSSTPGYCPFKQNDVLRIKLITGTKE